MNSNRLIMRVSIAMTTFNGERYLKEQLDSFLYQTQLPDELVICDDCSTDKTIEILEKFSSIAPFDVKIHINEKNLGFNRNFEKVIDLCKGDLIFISDHDDLWFENKIATMSNFILSKEGVFMAMNDCEMADSELRGTGISKIDQVQNYQGSIEGFIPGCCSVFLRKYKELIFPFPHNFSYDSWISFIGINTDTRVILKEILQLYRRYQDNTTNHPFNSLKNIKPIQRYLRGIKKIFSSGHRAEKRKYNLSNLQASQELEKRINKMSLSTSQSELQKNLSKMESNLRINIAKYENIEDLFSDLYFMRLLNSMKKLLSKELTFKDFLFVNF